VPDGGGLSARRCAKIYLCVAAPLLIALCCLTGPFMVPDEPAHFLRAVQISHGGVLPMLGPDGTSAGGLVDTAAIALVGDVMGHLAAFGADPRTALTEIVADGRRDAAGPLSYAAFSNTVIYFPLVYAAPALAIAAARQVGVPPLAWLYIGRLVNAGAALAVSAFAIALFEEAAIYAVVVCLIPRVLFEEASLSADALVIPFAMLFWALLASFAASAMARRFALPAFFLAMLVVCVGKFAYVPLAVLPPMVAAIERRRVPPVAALAAASALSVACWLGWSVAVRNHVFTIGPHVGVADTHRQLRAVLHDPARFAAALAGSFRLSQLSLFLGMVGPVAGWMHDVTLPWPILALSLLTLVAAAFFRRPGPVLRGTARAATGLAVLACVVAIYFLLYLNFTPLGSARVDGVQGRYFIPLLAAAPILLARTPHLGRWRPGFEYALVGCSIVPSLWLIVLVWRGFWVA
jgi:uncharacterized membrane protein